MPQPLAFVVPWYGARIPGGAETECRKTAEQLVRRGYPVEVLTTCGLQFHSDWAKNYHRPGLKHINGVPVRRFKVRPRNARRFHRLNLRLMRGYPVSRDEEADFMADMINSDDLCAFIAAQRDAYHFVFIPYLYGTTFFGAQIAPERSFMIPCLHAEAYAGMTVWPPVMRAVRGLILHSASELRLAKALYDIPVSRLHLLGEGVDTVVSANPQSFRATFGVAEAYIVYVGRRDETKNTPLLIEYFARYKAEHPGSLKLVLIGSGALSEAIRARADIVDAGQVSDRVKNDALAGAMCLCNPSLNESFSLALMESWVVGRPALVHAACAATADHCRASHGGLYFENYAEFSGAVNWFLQNPMAAGTMGQQGRQYVQANFGWDKIVKKIARLVYSDEAAP